MARSRRQNFSSLLKSEAKRFGVTNTKVLVDALSSIDIDVVVDSMVAMADHLVAKVKSKIESQPFWWEPLNPKYKKWKENQDLDERMLIATGEYLAAIGIQRVRYNKTSAQVSVGVPNTLHPKWEINFNTLGRYMESGTTKGVPARPHWGPAYKAWKKESKPYLRKLMDAIQADINKSLNKAQVSERGATIVKPQPSKASRSPSEPPASPMGKRPPQGK
jgi:hypothetical protein